MLRYAPKVPGRRHEWGRKKNQERKKSKERILVSVTETESAGQFKRLMVSARTCVGYVSEGYGVSRRYLRR